MAARDGLWHTTTHSQPRDDTTISRSPPVISEQLPKHLTPLNRRALASIVLGYKTIHRRAMCALLCACDKRYLSAIQSRRRKSWTRRAKRLYRRTAVRYTRFVCLSCEIVRSFPEELLRHGERCTMRKLHMLYIFYLYFL